MKLWIGRRPIRCWSTWSRWSCRTWTYAPACATSGSRAPRRPTWCSARTSSAATAPPSSRFTPTSSIVALVWFIFCWAGNLTEMRSLKDTCGMKLEIRRNLDAHLRRPVPDHDISGLLSTVECVVDERQYQLIRGLLSFNLGSVALLCLLLRRCHPVSPGFTGFHRDSLDFTGFYWVLLGFNEFYWVSVGFHWVLLFFSEFQWIFWVSLGFTGFYRVLLVFPKFKGFYWVSLGFTGFLSVLLGFTGFY